MNKIRIPALLAAIAVVCAACGPTSEPTVPPPPIPPPDVDGGVYDAGPDSPDAKQINCSSACIHLRALGCHTGSPTPKGATCEMVCQAVQANNGGAGFNVRCIVAARTCAAAELCR